jgi:probable rRNA maturation factor
MITFDSMQIDMPDLSRFDYNNWITRIVGKYGRELGDVNYMFCDDATILDYNRRFLGHDYYTDVITFDSDEGNTVNGDIIISLDTVRTNADEFGTAYEDEFDRVVIHGILHLCGINDKGPGEREIMEKAENEALAARNG